MQPGNLCFDILYHFPSRISSDSLNRLLYRLIHYVVYSTSLILLSIFCHSSSRIYSHTLFRLRYRRFPNLYFCAIPPASCMLIHNMVYSTHMIHVSILCHSFSRIHFNRLCCYSTDMILDLTFLSFHRPYSRWSIIYIVLQVRWLSRFFYVIPPPGSILCFFFLLAWFLSQFLCVILPAGSILIDCLFLF